MCGLSGNQERLSFAGASMVKRFNSNYAIHQAGSALLIVDIDMVFLLMCCEHVIVDRFNRDGQLQLPSIVIILPVTCIFTASESVPQKSHLLLDVAPAHVSTLVIRWFLIL